MADIAKTDDPVARRVKFDLRYFEEWNQLPSAEQQSTLEKFWEHKNIANLNEIIKDFKGYQELVKKTGNKTANAAAVFQLNRLVAQEVVKASVGGARSAAGRRGAVIVAEETARLAAARGAHVAWSGVTTTALSLPVSLSATVGEMTGDIIANQTGVKNHHAKNVLGVGGSMAGGAAAGAIIGGPIGAAAGAGVGVGSWAIGQGIKMILRTGSDPGGNWCYVDIGNIGGTEIWLGSYAEDDTLYMKTQSQYDVKRNNYCFKVSASQYSRHSFQLTIKKGWTLIHHLDEVYHRDIIGIVSNGRKWKIAHCKGQFHPVNSGEVKLIETSIA